MVSSGPYGWGKWRSKRSRLFFCLLDYFYGQKRPQNAINEVYPAISPPGVSKLVALRGSRLDLSRKHPGRCVGTIFGIWNCHRGAPECPKSASKCHKSGISGHKPPWWLQIGCTAWIKVGSQQETSGLMCRNHFSDLKLPIVFVIQVPGGKWPGGQAIGVSLKRALKM